jgi:endonuclease/exonuclease/phosphatase family metal-dependent hydrolase
MRLVSWNLDRGRAADAWQALARDHGADLVLLQEATKPQSDSVWHWEAVLPQLWGSAVVAMDGQLKRVEILEYRGWVTGARWFRKTKASVEEAYVFSIHSPTHHKEAPRKSYVREARTIVDRIIMSVPSDAPLVIGGDFNFASLGERVDGERRATDPSEQKALDEFRARGFLVAWRDLHPAAPLPQTLRWTGNRTTPFHCDGYLVRGLEGSRLTCEVILNEQCDAVSDHRPVTLVYAIGASVNAATKHALHQTAGGAILSGR